MSWGRREAYGLFFALAATVYMAVFFAARFDAAVRRPAAMGAAGLADLIFTVPLLYYFLIVRRRFGSWMSLIAVCLAGARASAILLTAGERAFLPALRWLGAPLELVVVWALVQRLRRIEGEGDVVGRLRVVARALVRNQRIAEMLACELSVFYYSFFSWRVRPHIPAGFRAFPYGEASGHRMFAMIMGAAVVFEGVPVHLLLRHWSATRPGSARPWTSTHCYGPWRWPGPSAFARFW